MASTSCPEMVDEEFVLTVAELLVITYVTLGGAASVKMARSLCCHVVRSYNINVEVS